jgi:BA14K-like protein
MEFMMINLRILTAAAVMALVLPMAAPVASFAQDHHGGGARPGGGRAGGGNFHGGGAHGPRFSGGGYRGGYHRGGGGGGAFVPGIVAGAVIGGAIASQGGYGGPGYYAPGYYDDQGYDDGAVAVAPAPGGDDGDAYCMQTYRSYDPQSGTYMGYDGVRHPCP